MSRIVAAAAALLAASSALGQTYDFTLNEAASSATWSAAVDAPFQTTPTGTSFLIGNYHAVDNPTGTRTIPGLFGGDLNANTPVPITAGSISADGASAEAVHPSGSFRLAVDTVALTCNLSQLYVELLGGTAQTIGTTVSVTYNSFRTRQPTCVIIGGFPIDLPLGGGEIAAINVTQINAGDAGTLTPAGGDSYTFSIPVMVSISVEATFNGVPVPVDPQDVALVLTGTVTLNGDSASIASNVLIDQNQTQPGPFVVVPMAFDEPVCGGHLLVNITLASVTVDLNADADLLADGDRVCAVDFDGDGFVTGADFDLYVQAFEAGDLAADFDGDGFLSGIDFDLYVQAFEKGC